MLLVLRPPPQAGAFQRWRLAWATAKRAASLVIADPETQRPAAECDLLLLAKDGVFLMQARRGAGCCRQNGERPLRGGWEICCRPAATLRQLLPAAAPWAQVPRRVRHMFLAPGGRAELLVRCSGPPGKRYVLGAQASDGWAAAAGSACIGGWKREAGSRWRRVGHACALKAHPALRCGTAGPGGRGSLWLPRQRCSGAGHPGHNPAGAGGWKGESHTLEQLGHVLVMHPSSHACGATHPGLAPALAAQAAASEPQPSPVPHACTPARPGYAADLRDEALQAAGASGALVRQPVSFTSSLAGFGCTVNGQVRRAPAALDARTRLRGSQVCCAWA